MSKHTGKRLYGDGVRVFVVLDFDGVLNTLYNKGTFPKKYFGRLGHFNQAAIVGPEFELVFPITFSHEMIQRLNALLGNKKTQLCWLTSWQEQVLEPAQIMGLTSKRRPVVINYLQTSDSNQDGKPAGLQRFLADVPDDAKIVWVDDTLHSGISRRHTEQVDHIMRQMHQQFLLIGPDDRYGISRAEMTEIESFVDDSVSIR